MIKVNKHILNGIYDNVLLNKMKELVGELAQMGKRSRERWEKFRQDQASSLR